MLNPIKYIMVLILVSTHVNSAVLKQSSVLQSHKKVKIGFNQIKQDDAWTVQWHVKNNSENHVEPIIVKRNFLCHNNTSTLIKSVRLGFLLAGSEDKSVLTDHNICPKSRIKLVEIETEIHLINKKTSSLQQ